MINRPFQVKPAVSDPQSGPKVCVPDSAPVVTPEVAAVLLRILLRRGEALGLCRTVDVQSAHAPLFGGSHDGGVL